ncbi:hypothetical protein RvY_12518 [Ramazzottius varieornatus]|uniref:CFAP65 fourth Ig-like domain-containing protein n=1 Tax=Ramazzottius varieornatus TaxID=947166 RepID=A0A1D1VTJ0_RAMVA|nr:hypothetical protein RvY_12518 [Ramazzottius varieornatus]
MEAPFTLSPAQGRVDPGRALAIEVTFHPSNVAEYQRRAVAVCEDDDPDSLPKSLSIELRGWGRCAVYLLYQPSPGPSNRIDLDFGVIAKKQTAVRSFAVFNTLAVNVPFLFQRKLYGQGANGPLQCQWADVGMEHAFQPVGSTSGTLKGQTWTEIPIAFRPDDSTNGDTGLVENFIFSSEIQDASMTIRCVGQVESSSVSASVDLLNFGLVFLHQSSSLHFKLDNQGLSSTFFQFDWAGSTDVFQVEPLGGNIAAGQSVLVTVHFHPLWPVLYRRLLRCLVHNEGVISIDVIGTCHSSLVQPPLLEPCHLETFSKQEMKELISMGPRMLKDQVECGILRVHTNHILERVVRGPEQAAGASVKTDENGQVERFEAETLPYQAWFSPQQDAVTQTVKMTSQANEPLIVNWTTQQNAIFRVEPASTLLPPRGAVGFTVTFSPDSSNLFFQWQATCHLMYEFLSSFQLVEEFQVIPPFCLNLSLSGHCATFNARRDLRPSLHYIDIKPPITFRQFGANGRSFATFVVTNPTANTVMYRLEKDAEKSLFISPRFGVMEPGDHRLIVAYLSSCRPKALISKELSLVLNDNEDSDATFPVQFRAFDDSEIRVTMADTLIFPDTFLNLTSQLPFELSSGSAFPLRYKWYVLDTVGRYLQVSPSSGLLISHDSLDFTFTFKPYAVQTYQTDLVLRVTAPSANFLSLRLSVTAKGTLGHLSVERKTLTL